MKDKIEHMRKKASKVLREIAGLKCLKDLDSTKANIQAYIERIEDRSFCVAVVGTVSSGKSTFLNALLGQDLLTHGSQETTAAITRLNNTDTADPRYGTCTVHYSNGTEKRLGNTVELSHFSAIQRAQDAKQDSSFDVSRDIAAVDLYPHFVNADMPVVFVDTPGLNGTADHHREKTLEQIRSAHACIYLLPVRGLSQFDVELIRDLCRYQHDFIFVQNFADSLKEEGEGEALEQKIQEQTGILRKEVFEQQPDARYCVCAISARNALIAKDHRFTKVYDTDAEELNEQTRAELYRESNFQSVLDEIQRLVSDNQKGIRQIQSTVASALLELSSQYTFLQQMQAAEQQTFENSALGRSIASLKTMESKLKELEQRNLQDLQNFWNHETHDNLIRQKELIGQEIGDIETAIHHSIEACTDLEKIDHYCNNNMLQKQLNPCITAAEQRLAMEFNEGFEASLSLAVARVAQYTGWSDIQKKTMPEADVQYDGKRAFDDMSDREGIARQEGELARVQQTIQSAQQELKRAKQTQETSERNLRHAQQKKTSEDIDYRQKVQKMGSEPEKEWVEKTGHRSHRGLFAGLRDKLFGYVEYTHMVEDTSKRDAWRRDKNQLDNTHRQNICDLENEIRRYQSNLNSMEIQIERSSNDVKNAQKRYKQLAATVQAMKDAAEEKRTKAMQEYVQAAQKALKRALDRYLRDDDDGLQNIWIDAFRQAAERNKANGWKRIEELFRSSMKSRLEELRKRIDTNDEQHTISYPDVDKFGKLLKKLEEVIA